MKVEFNVGEFVRPVRDQLLIPAQVLPPGHGDVKITKDRIYEVVEVGMGYDIMARLGNDRVRTVVGRMRMLGVEDHLVARIMVPVGDGTYQPMIVDADDLEPENFPMGKRLLRRLARVPAWPVLLAVLALILAAILVGCGSARPVDSQACKDAITEQVELIQRGADPRMPQPVECEGISDDELQRIVNEIYVEQTEGLA